MNTQNNSEQDVHEAVDVIIVGAGFGGLGMGTRLAREGEKSFVILERATEVGGTWRDNDYPGAACDVPSHLYSYSFRLNPEWSRTFAPQAEILGYLSDVAREEGLLPHIHFGAELIEARWDVELTRWVVLTPKGVFTATNLVTAVGHLSEPKLPQIPGMETFTGDMFHSAQWNRDVDLAGKRVGVVGSGATAIQVVPEVAKEASELVVFQRSAPYVTPRPDRAYTDAEKGMYRRLPETMEEVRSEMFWANEDRYAQRRGTPSLVNPAAKVAIDHLHKQIQDPALVAKLTPDYTFGCKRVLKSNDYYPTFNADHVTLDVGGVESIANGIVRSHGGESHELDVLIFCTGFEATDLPIAYRVFGNSGRSLSEQWANGMQAFATMAVTGFPNMWILNGPNTGLGHNSAVYIAESQIEYIDAALKYMDTNQLAVLEIDGAAEEKFMDRVERLAEGTVWLEGGCKSWYVDARNGRLTTLWPDPAYSFRQENGVFDPAPFELARRHTDAAALSEVR